MVKHTPKPWKAHELTRPIGLAKWQIHWSDDGECVADVVYEEADAKLIAAAPELLEACKTSLEIVETLPCECDDYHGFTCGLHDWKAQLERAIAKAQGAHQ